MHLLAVREVSTELGPLYNQSGLPYKWKHYNVTVLWGEIHSPLSQCH